MNLLKIFPILIYFVFSILSTSLAQMPNISSEATSFRGAPTITIGYISQLFFSLAIVFGLMYLISKYLLPKIKVSTKGDFLEVIDRVGLEPQVAAYIIKVKSSSWLVIVSNKNVSVVSKLEDL